jgi:hypothetical protein
MEHGESGETASSFSTTLPHNLYLATRKVIAAVFQFPNSMIYETADRVELKK